MLSYRNITICHMQAVAHELIVLFAIYVTIKQKRSALLTLNYLSLQRKKSTSATPYQGSHILFTLFRFSLSDFLQDFLCTCKAKNKQHRSALLSHLLLNSPPLKDFLIPKYLFLVYNNENIF